jgi:inward rectifier potassium channel
VITGLLYGRFSRPSARIRFSDNMLIAPYQDGISLQFRVANGRSNTLMDLEARMLLMTVERVDGVLQRKYAALDLERKSVYFFPLTWTIVHPIDENSPFYKKTAEDLARVEAEVLILIKGFDDTFSQVVHARYSYRHEDIVWGAKFVPAFSIDTSGDMVLEVDRVSDLKRLTS